MNNIDYINTGIIITIFFFYFIYRLDPLIIDHDIFIENSPTTLVDVVNILKNISDGKTNVTYNGNDVKVLFVSYTDSTNNQGNFFFIIHYTTLNIFINFIRKRIKN